MPLNKIKVEMYKIKTCLKLRLWADTLDPPSGKLCPPVGESLVPLLPQVVHVKDEWENDYHS